MAGPTAVGRTPPNATTRAARSNRRVLRRRWAAMYADRAAESHRPIVDLAAEHGWSESTVRDLSTRRAIRGLLTASPRGRSDGELTERGETPRAIGRRDAKSEGNDLAPAVRERPRDWRTSPGQGVDLDRAVHGHTEREAQAHHKGGASDKGRPRRHGSRPAPRSTSAASTSSRQSSRRARIPRTAHGSECSGQRGKPSTFAGYEHITKQRIIPALGDLRIAEITPGDLAGFYAALRAAGRRDGDGGLSERSVKHTHGVLHSRSSTQSMPASSPETRRDGSRGSYSANPTKRRDEDVEPYGAAHVPFVSRAGPASYCVPRNRGPHRRSSFRDSADSSGMTSTSIVRWSRCVVVEQRRGTSFTRASRSRVERARLHSIPRRLLCCAATVPINSRSASRGAKRGRIPAMCSPVRMGSRCTRSCSPMLSIAVKSSSVPSIRFHDLRHTHATLLLEAGVHPKVVQERLGHSSISITLDLYSHVTPGMQEDAAAKLGETVFG